VALPIAKQIIANKIFCIGSKKCIFAKTIFYW